MVIHGIDDREGHKVVIQGMMILKVTKWSSRELMILVGLLRLLGDRNTNGPGEVDQDLAEGLENADQPVMEEAFVCDEQGFEEDHDGGIEMVEEQVHSGPGEVEPGQDGGLKMKRFNVLISTFISNYCAGVTSRLQGAHHQ